MPDPVITPPSAPAPAYTKPIQTLAVLGLGLLGGSMGLAAIANRVAVHVVGWSHRRETRDTALARRAVHSICETPEQAVGGADMVVLATPIDAMPDLMKKIAPALVRGTLVTDVGSTKRRVVTAAAELLPRHVLFCGSHPMAGGEKGGIAQARVDLFQGQLAILTPIESTDPRAIHSFEQFYLSLGMRVARMRPDTHDRRIAMVSHMPHVVAAAIVGAQADSSQSLAGPGYRDATRIAMGDPSLWADIVLDNRDNFLHALDRVSDELQLVKQLVNSGDRRSLLAWLEENAKTRKEVV